jgi:hypothetical protein
MFPLCDSRNLRFRNPLAVAATARLPPGSGAFHRHGGYKGGGSTHAVEGGGRSVEGVGGRSVEGRWKGSVEGAISAPLAGHK